ncbi:hypothetical protein DS031_22425 [Bacillus taeanensis]|uniref:Uncharacterized protein n=1 Tax=Bacillus taeanensis TaxID=273032 RepID=A0A366XTE5_9BACI|nr:hypothetical protein DS031_22425 [Bacillus taeanensis]
MAKESNRSIKSPHKHNDRTIKLVSLKKTLVNNFVDKIIQLFRNIVNKIYCMLVKVRIIKIGMLLASNRIVKAPQRNK